MPTVPDIDFLNDPGLEKKMSPGFPEPWTRAGKHDIFHPMTKTNHPSQDTQDAFFREAVLAVSSSLELPEALRALFDFAKRHFPLEGLSLHRYVPQMKSLHLLFLVTEDSYIYLDQMIPLSREALDEVLVHEKALRVSNVTNCMERPLARHHGQALANHLPFKERAYLVSLLAAKQEVFGHLCLMGTSVGCFTPSHEEKLAHLIPPVSLAMMNLLQYRRTLELQKKLDAQRLQLQGEVTLLKDSPVIMGQEGLAQTMKMVRQLAGREIPVLILGETGTGKELIADAVQRVSPRKDGPYIKVNCGAIPETLVDSELFGYEKGAFTGAHTDRAGRFEQADGGTLFLDEIGDLPLQLQVRLLRVLQNGVIERLGSANPIPVDVRIIAATHRPLESMLQKGTFREDLYYRLSAFPLSIPPLRERTRDLPVLIHHFIKRNAKAMQLPQTPRLAQGSLEKLSAYSWPGNIRELENLVERTMTLDPDGPLQPDQYLPQDPSWFLTERENGNYLQDLVEKQVEAALDKRLANGGYKATAALAGEKAAGDPEKDLKTLDEAMADHIQTALEQCRGKIHGPGGAAELLDIHPSTLRKRMNKLNIVYGYKR